MSALHEYLKTESSVTVVSGLLASHTKKIVSLESRIERLINELNSAQVERDRAGQCLNVIRQHAETMHKRSMSPVDKTLEGLKPDIDFNDTESMEAQSPE